MQQIKSAIKSCGKGEGGRETKEGGTCLVQVVCSTTTTTPAPLPLFLIFLCLEGKLTNHPRKDNQQNTKKK